MLCPTHHAGVTKGIIPKDQITEAYQNPAAKAAGFSTFNHPWFRGIPSLKMGGGPLVVGTPIPIQVKGENIIQFDSPLDGSEVSQISANLRDASGLSFLQIQRNEWKVISGSWDFQLKGNRYIFNDKSGLPMLRLRMEPPNFIAIELFKTSVHGIPIHITEDSLVVGSNNMTSGIFSNCMIGISVQ